RAILYCLHAYCVYKKLAILVAICIERGFPGSLMDTFKPCMRCKLMPFSLSKSTIQGYTNENNLHPLVVFTMFQTHKQRCILILTRWDDPTAQQLYLIARRAIEGIEKEQDERIVVLQTICGVNET
ncbi:hypothetical protein BCV72DRAFT_313730, partial [Rhizopus microsporus var. microsporus]